MEAKFSKGPWAKACGGESEKIRGIDDAHMNCVVRWGGIARPESEEGQANAALMIASPLLYEALEAVEWSGPQYDNGVTIINTCPHCGMDEPGGHSENCIIGNALRAARGEK